VLRSKEGAMSEITIESAAATNPIDLLEEIVQANEWAHDRASDEEMVVEVSGRWCDYRMFFLWQQHTSALHFSCGFDMKVPKGRRGGVYELLAAVNEKMWIGHFDLWTQDGLIMYRHALVLAGGVEASSRQCEALLGTALDACERYFPAFQFVVWAGKPAREALDAAMFETQGQA